MTEAGWIADPPSRRARLPDDEGTVVRDGVRVAWSSYGTGAGGSRERTVLLLPAWSIVDSRIWKAQVGFLARHARVITFDGRGSGRSDRPVDPACYTDAEYVADAVAVLDAAAVEKAVVVGLSSGGDWAVRLAAGRPDRVAGLLAIGPSCYFAGQPEPSRTWWQDDPADPTGWQTYSRAYWQRGGFPAFVEHFFAQMFPEPHSTKQIEDGMSWAYQTGWQAAAAARDGRAGLGGAVREPIEPFCAQVSCPVLVLHGTDDRIVPIEVGERLAVLLSAPLVRLDGVGHAPVVREPVLVNTEITAFLDRVWPVPGPVRSWRRPLDRSPRVLYLSSPIGLGHARRDVAIAQALRERRPDVRIDWLAQDPVTRVLADERERIHPASAWLAGESAHLEASALDHDLHAFQAVRSMDEILINNYLVFDDVVAETSYDLVIGDEAWDVDYFLHENPERKRYAYAWFTDFVGWLPMPAGGEREAALTADYNAEMIEQRARYRRLRDRSIFVGDPGDVVDATFGAGLPKIRDWTAANFSFAGYMGCSGEVTADQRAVLRARHGYRDDQQVCVVTVGGSGVGQSLLRRVLDAVPVVRRSLELEFLVVAGPRIDPAVLPAPPGVRVVGYLSDLLEHLIACDVALVQGGLSTCMELTAARRPFVYVPLRNHFEQNLHVRHRLDRYRAGRHLPYERACVPELLAAELQAALEQPIDYLPVATDGATRAATLLADLV